MNETDSKLAALSAFLIALMLASTPVAAQSSKLLSIHEVIEEDYPAVDHIDSQTFLESKSTSQELVVFDVREPEEYAVSHLKGAIQVDPDISQEDFLARFGDVLKDKQVVFYCSVGRRSSLLADKVSDSLFESGAEEIFNLKHGIFGWHDEEKPLVIANQSTEYVHPFSWRWKRYLKRKEFARYQAPED